MKNIALFSDGTGNSSANPQKTNVWRLYQALDRRPGSNQIAYYDNGVGTSPFKPTALLGLGFGFGLAHNVRDIYGFLCRTYNPGDKIYGFGFSRGAFTIRVVMALIASEGIIDRNIASDDRDLDRLVRSAYWRFRRKSFNPSLLSFFLAPARDWVMNAWERAVGHKAYDHTRNIRSGAAPDDEPLIQFVGVWDTVDAYGLPIDELTRAWDRVVWPLTAKDRDLSPRVARACQALAIDEQRESFEPMLWNEHGAPLKATLDHERISQVWFAGVHSNVGGGYPDDSLALVSLNWMLEESRKNNGLRYLKEERQRYADMADASGPINDSRSGLGTLYRYAPRRIERLCGEKKPGLANWLKGKMGMSGVEENEVRIVKPKIHHTVFQRLTESGSYAPINIPADYAVVEADGTVIDIATSAAHARTALESPAGAQSRRTRQSYAWNKVWGRKLIYFMMLVAIAAFIIYPYRPFFEDGQIESAVAPYFGTLGFVIQSVPGLIGKIPGLSFAEQWATEYARYPYVFMIGVIAIGALLISSLKVNAALNSEMRINWHHLTQTGAAPPARVSAFRQRLAAFLEGPTYADRIALPVRVGLESLAVLFLLLLLAAACSRTYFTVADGTGHVCAPDRAGAAAAFGEPFRFVAKDPCFDTGLTLVKDRTYAVELYLPAEWSDAGVPADLDGWREANWWLYLFTPFRRHLFVGWYRPVARIDDHLFDRYPLRTEERPGVPATGARTYLRHKFGARRSGRLYLYLNDAVLFSPHLVGRFYDNNVGHACVRVIDLTAAPDQAQPGSAAAAATTGLEC